MPKNVTTTITSSRWLRSRAVIGLAFLGIGAAALVSSCGSPATDTRTVIPSDVLVYLETKNLGKAVGAVTSHPKFAEAAVSIPDLSFLNGMEMSVAVTGFESGETQLNEEASVLNIQPRFVAAIETRKWNFQVLSFVEEQLGSFISDVYGGEATLDVSDKHGGKYFVWSAQDGRKAYGLVIGSLILFGNDDSAIEKCIAVRNGEGESIKTNPKITDGERLAFGYVSPDGIAQIANIAGLSLAKDSGEDAAVQSFVARVMPELLRNSLREATWTTAAADGAIVDTFDIQLNSELAGVLGETLTPSAERPDARIIAAMLDDAQSFTRYDLRDPQIAWRSIQLSTQKLTDPTTAGLLLPFSSSLFEPYGVEDPEAFLSSIGPIIYTSKLDIAGDKVIAAASVKDHAKMKASLARELNMNRAPEKVGNADSWISEDGDVRVLLDGSLMMIGDPMAVQNFYQTYTRGVGDGPKAESEDLLGSTAAAATVSFDRDIYGRIAGAISEKRPEGPMPVARSFTETRFNKNGIERRSISETGLIGTIIAALSPE